jgi:hypothetical protein
MTTGAEALLAKEREAAEHCAQVRGAIATLNAEGYNATWIGRQFGVSAQKVGRWKDGKDHLCRDPAETPAAC